MAVVRWRVVGVASPPDELGGVYTRGLATLAAAAIELGGTELLAAERAAQELVAAEPLGEGATALLMRALDIHEALTHFRELAEGIDRRDPRALPPG